MKDDLDKKIEAVLIGIMADGFNRSLNVLEENGAINRKEMNKEYSGVGSKYYDMVTEQFEYTAHYAKESILKIIEEEKRKN